MERESFEIKSFGGSSDGHFVYVTVVDKFYHHYTKETMRYIRMETVGSVTGVAMAQYKMVNEAGWKSILASRVGGRK